jgi:hypothetical protein
MKIDHLIKWTSKRLKFLFFSKITFLFYEYNLNDLMPSCHNSHDIFFERYSTANANLLKMAIDKADGPQRFSMKDVDQRINQGHYLYVAKKYNKIIGYVWYVINEFRIPFFSGTIYLKADEICALNAFIQKEFRGLGILNSMRRYVYNELKKKYGYSRVITFIDSDNHSAKRMHTKFESIPIGIIEVYNILTLRFRFCTVKSNKIVFYETPLVYWKKLFKKICNR